MGFKELTLHVLKIVHVVNAVNQIVDEQHRIYCLCKIRLLSLKRHEQYTKQCLGHFRSGVVSECFAGQVVHILIMIIKGISIDTRLLRDSQNGNVRERFFLEQTPERIFYFYGRKITAIFF